jgi:hypothetical protein
MDLTMPNDSIHELLLWYNIHKEHNLCQVCNASYLGKFTSVTAYLKDWANAFGTGCPSSLVLVNGNADSSLPGWHDI